MFVDPNLLIIQPRKIAIKRQAQSIYGLKVETVIVKERHRVRPKTQQL